MIDGGLTIMLPCDIFDLRKNRLVPTKERLPLVVLRQGSNVVSWDSLPHGTIYKLQAIAVAEAERKERMCEVLNHSCVGSFCIPQYARACGWHDSDAIDAC